MCTRSCFFCNTIGFSIIRKVHEGTPATSRSLNGTKFTKTDVFVSNDDSTQYYSRKALKLTIFEDEFGSSLNKFHPVSTRDRNANNALFETNYNGKQPMKEKLMIEKLPKRRFTLIYRW